jgi:hypothetical protein
VTATPGQAARDHQAEQDYAAFTAWWESKGYADGATLDFSDARDAYGSGMRDARDLAAAQEPHAAPGPAVCECGHAWAHHAFSDDVCAVVDCPCARPRPAPRPAPELQAGEIAYLYHWRFDRGEEFGLYRHAADADAKAAEHAGDGLSGVLSMAILGRPDPKPAPELAAATRETKAVLDLLDDFTHAVIDLDDAARLVSISRLAAAARGARKKAGLPPVEGK